MKTSELSGALLDYWAGRSNNINPAALRITNDNVCEWRERDGSWRRWSPSTKWQQGGPVIENEKIELAAGTGEFDGIWAAMPADIWSDVVEEGKTPLEAAMRCFVASKFGDDVSDEISK